MERELHGGLVNISGASNVFVIRFKEHEDLGHIGPISFESFSSRLFQNLNHIISSCLEQ